MKFPIDLKETMFAIEAGYLKEAIAQAKGNCAEAARLLKIQESTFKMKLRRHQFLVKKQVTAWVEPKNE